MKAIVCVKHVGALGDEFEFAPDGRSVDPDYLDFAPNEWDLYATEEALQIREAVAQADFAVAAGRALHRPVWLRVPAAPIRLLAGEMAQLFVDGQRVVPQRLLAAGYVFRFPTLRAALDDLT